MSILPTISKTISVPWLVAILTSNPYFRWLPVKPADKTLFAGKNSKILRHLTGGAKAFAQRSTKKLESMGGAFAIMSRAWNENLNSRRNAQRDSREGLFQVPLAQSEGSRIGVRSLIASTIADGYPLTVRTNCFVTKITFDKTGDTPKATGVEFLDGRQLYRASPLSGGRGVQGSATATKETIISAGAFNTPQYVHEPHPIASVSLFFSSTLGLGRPFPTVMRKITLTVSKGC